MPEQYIGPSETILLSFGLSWRYFLTRQVTLWISAGALAFLMWSGNIIGPVVLFIAATLFLYDLIIFYCTNYFVTERRIYKKTGFVWRRLAAADKNEITDFVVKQGLFERIFYGSGTIEINTSGSAIIEIILIHVASPFAKKKQIQALWEGAGDSS